MKKQLLIILGVVLIVVILFLGLYAYQITQISEPVSPNLSTKSISKEFREIKSEKEQSLDPEEIKKKMNEISNETFQVNEEDCDEDSTKEYTQDIMAGESKSSEGIVLETNNSKLKVEFYQGSYKWISEVEISDVTDISSISSTGETRGISLTDIKVQDKVIIKSADNKIVDEKFKAEIVYVYR